MIVERRYDVDKTAKYFIDHTRYIRKRFLQLFRCFREQPYIAVSLFHMAIAIQSARRCVTL